MTSRLIAVEVERTLIYRRTVYVEVEETDERKRLAQAGRPFSGSVYEDDAQDVAVEKAKILTGWEPGADEYRAVAAKQVESAPNIDVQV